MIKDLFTGSLGKLNNHGGSRIYTTPNTILVPPEYEVDIGEHGDFISCSLDGRLWLFKNKIIALKWNEETGRMEFSASRSFNNNQFIARGIDWILTKTYIIQYNNGKIVVEAHKIKDIQPMENFYSLLPALDGFQIIKGYLIRKPGAEHTDLVYPVNNAGIFLVLRKIKYIRETINKKVTIKEEPEIWGKNSSYAGEITVEKNDSEYKLNVASTYSVSGDITGITFLNDKLYGFQLDGNHKGLCYASQNLNLYSFAYGEWETLSEATGKIYFDVFNHKALALHDKGMEILPDRKKVECNALEQWIAPTKELHYVSNNIIISALSDKVLTTDLIFNYYRSLLKANKELPITSTAYNSWKLAVGSISNKLNFNALNVNPFSYKFEFALDIDVELLNIFEFKAWNIGYYSLKTLNFYDKKSDILDEVLLQREKINPTYNYPVFQFDYNSYYKVMADFSFTAGYESELEILNLDGLNYHVENSIIIVDCKKGEIYSDSLLKRFTHYGNDYNFRKGSITEIKQSIIYYMVNPENGTITCTEEIEFEPDNSIIQQYKNDDYFEEGQGEFGTDYWWKSLCIAPTRQSIGASFITKDSHYAEMTFYGFDNIGIYNGFLTAYYQYGFAIAYKGYDIFYQYKSIMPIPQEMLDWGEINENIKVTKHKDKEFIFSIKYNNKDYICKYRLDKKYDEIQNKYPDISYTITFFNSQTKTFLNVVICTNSKANDNDISGNKYPYCFFVFRSKFKDKE